MPGSIIKVWIHIFGLLSTATLGISRTFVSIGNISQPYTITQVKNPHWSPKKVHVAELLAAPFRKHRIPMPKALQIAVDDVEANSTATGSVRRANGQSVAGSSGQFVFPVRIGTPSQTLYLLFDTGSGDFWVWSWLMPKALTSGRNIYVGTNSSSSAATRTQSFSVNYASGSAYGVVWNDDVWIDGNGGVSIGVLDNPVECAQNVGGVTLPALTAVDGLFGLNLWVNDSEAPIPQQTWFSYVAPSLAAPIFTVCLVQNGIGTMDFGFIDSSKYTGSIAYTPVATLASWPGSGYWLFNWSGFAIGTHAFNSTSIQILTDTGVNLINLPESIATSYYAQVKGSYMSDGGWAFPCAAILPTFTFGIGSSRFVVKAKHMIFVGLDDGTNCIGAIQPTDENSFAIFGVPWISALFLVHDYGKKRMGFAARVSD
ncbi:hypothetical protein LSUE1_G006009 [Lachnellula suecica]|uniref:Peptidase A1 domain-containing protein n=1 Tax=Lachnellula suecica TaxID=602035 RepID=A0A8T9C4U0_9HELO|nr:hypothetical protein LSUE1_G006009 [Lachnellula suecica]